MSVGFSQEADGKLVGWEWIQMRSASGARGGVPAPRGRGRNPSLQVCSADTWVLRTNFPMSLGCRKPYRMDEWMNPCRKVGPMCVTSEPLKTGSRGVRRLLGPGMSPCSESGTVLVIVNTASLGGTIIMEKTSLGQACWGLRDHHLNCERNCSVGWGPRPNKKEEAS